MTGREHKQESEPLALRVRPQADECFDSWIERMALAHDTTRGVLFQHLGIDASLASLDLARGTSGVALEHQFAVDQMVGQLAWAVQVEPEQIESTFLDIDGAVLLPRRLRQYGCARCWQEAIRDGRPRIIRKEWILRMSWRCRLHDLALSKLPVPDGAPDDQYLLTWLSGALVGAESLRWGLDYRGAMIERNEVCLDMLIRHSRRRLKGRKQDYLDRFRANAFHFARDRIAMLALAHSHAGRGVWGFERLLALGLAERPGRNLESLKAPKPTKRLTACWRVGQGRAPHRAFEAELLDVLLAYAHLRERRDGETLARARFGHFRTFGSQDASAVAM